MHMTARIANGGVLDRSEAAEGGPATAKLPVLVAAVAALGILTWATTPALGHFSGALIPWPTHGAAIAILIATPQSRRVLIAGLIALALVGAASASAVSLGQDPYRVIPAVSLLFAQTMFVVVLYDRLARWPELSEP